MSSLLAADPALLFWSLAFIHIAGLVSMLLARVPRSHRVHALCHHGFFACLLFIGVVTLLNRSANSPLFASANPRVNINGAS